MKKISIAILALALVFSMTGCRRNKAKETTAPTTRATTPTTQATTPTTKATEPSMDMMPDATGNIGDRDNGVIGDDGTENSGATEDTIDRGVGEATGSTSATGESGPEGRSRGRGMMGNIG